MVISGRTVQYTPFTDLHNLQYSASSKTRERLPPGCIMSQMTNANLFEFIRGDNDTEDATYLLQETLATAQQTIGWVSNSSNESLPGLLNEIVAGEILPMALMAIHDTHVCQIPSIHATPRRFNPLANTEEVKRWFTVFTQFKNMVLVSHDWQHTMYSFFIPCLMRAMTMCYHSISISYPCHGPVWSFPEMRDFLQPSSDLYWQNLLEGLFWWLAESPDTQCYQERCSFLFRLISALLFQLTACITPTNQQQQNQNKAWLRDLQHTLYECDNFDKLLLL